MAAAVRQKANPTAEHDHRYLMGRSEQPRRTAKAAMQKGR